MHTEGVKKKTKKRINNKNKISDNKNKINKNFESINLNEVYMQRSVSSI